MRARTFWMVTGALGVVGVSGIAIVNAAVPDEVHGDGAVVTQSTGGATIDASGPTRTATSAPSASEGPSDSPTSTAAPTPEEPTTAVPSAPSPVPAGSAGSPASAASAASGG